MRGNPYTPVLINLVDSPPSQSPKSIEQEEKMIDNWVREGVVSWKQVSKKFKSLYGFDFLLNIPPKATVGKHTIKHDKVEESGLLIQAKDQKWFILKNPAQLVACADCIPLNTRPAFARSSDILNWKAGSKDLHKAKNIPDVQIPISSPDNKSLIKDFLEDQLPENPSDWHLYPKCNSYESTFRISGSLISVSPMPYHKGVELINALRVLANAPIDNPNKPVDAQCQISVWGHSIQLRLSIIPSLNGMSLAVRFLPDPQKVIELSSIGMRKELLSEWTNSLSQSSGLWLVAGPTGAGKSTTLNATIRMLLKNNEKILSAEDPVEYSIPGVFQVNVCEEQSIHFSTLLRAFMRQAPDTILLGEIRDSETAKVAITAAVSGHRILSSLHAKSAISARERLVEMGADPHVLKIAGRSILNQYLARSLCPDCKIIDKSPMHGRSLVQFPQNKQTLAHKQGCPKCRFIGYSGRSALFGISSLSSKNSRFPLSHAAEQCLMNHETTIEEVQPLLSPDSPYRKCV